MSRRLVCNRWLLFSVVRAPTRQAKSIVLTRAPACVRYESTTTEAETRSTDEGAVRIGAHSQTPNETATKPKPPRPGSRRRPIGSRPEQPGKLVGPLRRNTQHRIKATDEKLIALAAEKKSIEEEETYDEGRVAAITKQEIQLLKRRIKLLEKSLEKKTAVQRKPSISPDAQLKVIIKASRNIHFQGRYILSTAERALRRRLHLLQSHPPVLYDPDQELKDFKGPHDLPGIEEVKRGRISLDRARIQRRHNLMAVMGNVDMVRRMLVKEDMLGSVEKFAVWAARYQGWIQQRAEVWRQAAIEHEAAKTPTFDPEVKMVHPTHVPGRRMGPPKEEADHETYQQLVESHAAEHGIGDRSATSSRQYNSPSIAASVRTREQVRQFTSLSRRPQAAPKHDSRSITGQLQIGEQTRQYTTASRPRPAYKSRAYPSKPGPTSAKAPNPALQALQAASSQSSSPPPKPTPESWRVQKSALASKFGSTGGWSPRRKLSPDAMLHLRTLHESNPSLYTTPLLASTFKTSPEAIRRILKSKWLSQSAPEKMQDRRERWAKRHDRIWDVQSELGLRPERRKERRVEDADTGGERVEGDLQAQDILRRGREENRIFSDGHRN